MTQKFVTLPREVVEQAIDALYCTNSKEGSPTYNFELKAIKELRAALEQQQTTEKSLAVEKQLVGVVGWRNHIPNSVTVVHWTGLIPPVGTELYIGQQPQVEQEPAAWLHSEGKTQPLYLHTQPQVEQEPVAWCELDADRRGIAYFDGKPIIMTGPSGNEHHPDPLYTNPQPHTNEKPIAEVIVSHVRSGLDGRYTAEVAGYERLSVGAELFVRPQPPALEQPQNHVPDVGNMVQAGWKLVPVEPTQAMLDQLRFGWSDISTAYVIDRWKRTIAAAPQPPTTEQSSEVEQPQDGQEPVAWIEPGRNRVGLNFDYEYTITEEHPRDLGWLPLYTRQQPKRETLTDEQSRRIYDSATYAASLAVFMTRVDAEHPDADDKGVSGWLQEAEDRVKHRAIEAAHNIK